MAYSKEYYESNKERLKKIRNRYRNKNKEWINKQQRDKYRNLSNSQKQEICENARKKRKKNIELYRLQHRIYQQKGFLRNNLKQYEEYTKDPLYAIINKKDFKEADACYEAQDLFKKMHKLNEKIELRTIKIAELEKEKEEMIKNEKI